VFIDTARFLKVYARIGNRKDSRAIAPVDRNRRRRAGAPLDSLPASDAVEILVDGQAPTSSSSRARAWPTWSPATTSSRRRRAAAALGPRFWHRVHAAADEDRVRRDLASSKRAYAVDVIGLEPAG